MPSCASSAMPRSARATGESATRRGDRPFQAMFASPSAAASAPRYVCADGYNNATRVGVPPFSIWSMTIRTTARTSASTSGASIRSSTHTESCAATMSAESGVRGNDGSSSPASRSTVTMCAIGASAAESPVIPKFTKRSQLRDRHDQAGLVRANALEKVHDNGRAEGSGGCRAVDRVLGGSDEVGVVVPVGDEA